MSTSLGSLTIPGVSKITSTVRTLQELCEDIVVAHFRDEMKVFVCEDIVENLQKKMSQWRQVKYFRSYKEWYKNGQLSWYETYNNEGIKEGPSIQWYGTGRIKLQSAYLNGQLNGEWKLYYSNGKLWSHRQYRNGKLSGEAKSYNESGVLISCGSYADGQRHGEYKAYTKDGNVMCNSRYYEGKRNGKCVYWWPNGSKYLSLNYVNGEKHGKCKEWTQNGQLKKTEYFNEGQKVWLWCHRPGLNFLNCFSF